MSHRFSKSQVRNNFQDIQMYILLRESLTKQFNAAQWKQLTVQNLGHYYLLQNQIFDLLMQNVELFSQYFPLFYQNHVSIYHWYLLARQNHHEIQLYVFKELLSKKLEYYWQSLNFKANQKQVDKISKGKSKQLKRISQLEHKSSINELSNDIFNFMASKSITASLKSSEKPWKSKSKMKKDNRSSLPNLEFLQADQTQQIRISSKESSIRKSAHISPKGQLKNKVVPISPNKYDFHDLYVKTFDACKGHRYIFYNFQKHMKGLNQKDKYNMFIRNPKTKPVLNSQSEQVVVLKENINVPQKIIRSSFEYSPIGNSGCEKKRRRSSQVTFKKLGSQNIGKFIRK